MSDGEAARARLDRERTALANERTLLAYIRTALAIAAAGASLRFLPNLPDGVRAGSWSMIGLAVATLVVGLWRFTVFARRLRRWSPSSTIEHQAHAHHQQQARLVAVSATAYGNARTSISR